MIADQSEMDGTARTARRGWTRAPRPLRAALLTAAVALLTAALLPLPGEAREVEGITLTESAPEVLLDYPPIPGFRTWAENRISWTYQECELADWCDLILLTFEPGRANGHRTSFELTDPRELGPFPLIQVRLYFFDERGETDDDDATSRDRPQAASFVEEEQGRIVGSITDLQPGQYWLAVACTGRTAQSSTRCTEGYTIHALLEFEDIYQPPPTGGPTFRPPPPAPEPPAQPDPRPGVEPDAGVDPPRAPLQPGEDGPRADQEVGGLPAGQQAAPPENRMWGIANALIVALIAGVIIGGSFGLAVRIRRDLGGT